MPKIICKNGGSRRFAPPSNDWIKPLMQWTRKNLFLLTVFAGAAFGVCAGLILRTTVQSPINPNILVLVGFPGELFLRTFKMLLLPLVVASITTASSNLNAKTSGKMAAVTLAYFLLTSFASACIGLIMATVVHPGSRPDDNQLPSIETVASRNSGDSQLLDTILDLIRNMLPENIIQACLQQVQTVYTPLELSSILIENRTADGIASMTLNQSMVDVKKTLIYRNQANFLGLIVSFFVFGIVLGVLGEKAKPLANIFAILDSAILLIVTKFTWFTPIGVASLIAERILALPKLDLLVAQIAIYSITVIGTLIIHIFIFIPIVYFLIVRKNPFEMLNNVLQALIAGFATDSSAIALPLTLHCMEEKLRVDSRVTRFVLPMGVTVNMDGTAAFLALAAIFLAQMSGVQPTFGEKLSIIFSSTLVSVASVAAPSASLFLLGIVTSVVPGIKTENISLLFAFDFLLSRCRTISNILGDCCGSAVVQHFCLNDLRENPLEETDILKENIINDNRDKEEMETFTV